MTKNRGLKTIWTMKKILFSFCFLLIFLHQPAFGENVRVFEFPQTRHIQDAQPLSMTANELKTKQKGITEPEPLSAAASISNEHLTVNFNNYGQFTMQRTSDGKWLLYPSEGTTYISVKVNDIVYQNREQHIGNLHTSLTRTSPESAYIEYMTPEDIKIRITYTLRGESLALHASAVNNSNQSHFVKTRFFLDTQLDQNDGAPLYAPNYTHPDGASILTHEAGVSNPVFTRWGAQDRFENPTFRAYGYFQNRPYLMVFSYWPNAVSEPWDYDWREDRDFSSDSAVILYFDMGLISPGESSETVTYYGLDAPNITVIYDRLKSACDMTADTIKTLSKAHTRELSRLFAKGHATLEDEHDHQRAQTIVKSISALLNLTRALTQSPEAVASSKNELVGMLESAGFSSDVADSIVELWTVKSYLEDAWAVAQGLNVSREIMMEEIEIFLDNLGNQEGYVSQENIEEELFVFLWEKMEWRDQGGNYAKGLKGFHEEVTQPVFEQLAENWQAYSEEDDEEVLLAVIKKLESFQNGLQAAESSSRLFLWLNANALKSELGNIHAWQIILDEAIKDLESPASRWGSWGFTGLSTGVAIGKAALALKSGGISAVAELAIGVTVSLASGAHEIFVRAPREARLQSLTYDNIIASIQEDINLGKASFEMGKYLDYDQVALLKEQLAVDNTNIVINSLKIEGEDDIEFRREEMLDISSFIDFSIINEGSDRVPVDAVLLFYDYDSDASIAQEPTAIAFLDEGTFHSYAEIEPAGGAINLQFNDTLLSYDTGSGFDYIVKAYVAPGPAINSKLIGPKMVSFNIQRDRDAFFWRSERTVVVEDRISQGTAHEVDYVDDADTVFSDLSLIYSGSDLNLHVYDDYGRHVGVNYDTGEVENEIPGASYSGPAANPQWLRLPNSSDTGYTTRIVALDGEDVGYSLSAVKVPDLPAMLSFGRERFSATINRLEEEQAIFNLLIKEVGGQREVEDLTIHISDLEGATGKIQASRLRINMEEDSLSPSEVLPIQLTITDISSFPEGDFEGTLTVRGTQGAQSEARQLSAPAGAQPLSAGIDEIEAEIPVLMTVRGSEDDDEGKGDDKGDSSSSGCFVNTLKPGK